MRRGAAPRTPRHGWSRRALVLGVLTGCADPVWVVSARDDSGWTLSVSATAERILAVGGQPGAGGHLSVVRGASPAQVARRTDLPHMLWWVHGLGQQAAWMAGEGGLVLRYAESVPPGESPTVASVPAQTDQTLYGVWAFSDDDVWAVGGDDLRGGVVLHGGRAGLVVDTTVPRTGTLYKIYGADPQHLFVVGAGGALLRRVGATWHADPPLIPRNERLLGVYGRGADEVWAVGGNGQARALRWDGAAWTLLPTPGLGGLAGVFAGAADVLVVGGRGLLAQGPGLGDAPFAVMSAPITEDLHAAFALPGESFAVGGNLGEFGLHPPRGVILHRGDPPRVAE